MVNVYISPCVYTPIEIPSLMYLHDKLKPILDYFNVSVVLPDNTSLSENSWYNIPPYNRSVYDYFSCYIIPLLKRCISQCKDSESLQYTLSDNFEVLDVKDFNQLVKCISKETNKCYLLVNENNNSNESTVLITIDDKTMEIPLLRDVLKDELIPLCEYIKIDFSNKDEPFPNKDLCLSFAEKSGKGATVADFKHYSHLILLRNGYRKTGYQSDNYKNTSTYIRQDGKFKISLDCLHNTFEVFDCTKQQETHTEYTTAGKKVLNKTSKAHNHRFKK